ncbi:maker192 [Drosophila busckii]|uniref:Maker192 n=1 Tax=Drosophila busckii TaxID=30019 RepID=A0A0M4F4I8_DROBS|nr:maker192 [Drosophila busckii]
MPQKLLRSTKKKLSDFAAETLTNISKHFRLLHCQLQNAQLQAIEQLRESSLPTQMQLNGAMSQLNGYESLLKRLRQMLLNDDAHSNICLKQVIELIEEHLERIPTTIDVSKFEANPYHYSSAKDKLNELFRQPIVCKFVDPHIKVRFSNQHGQLSNSTSSMSVDKKKKPARRVKAANGGGNSSSYSSSDSLHLAISQTETAQQLLRSFTALDISNASSGAAARPAWFKSDTLVFVRSIKSPEDFYVQCDALAQRIRELLANFVTTPACLPPAEIIVGQQYLTAEQQTDIERWHRALVCQKSQQLDVYNVLLPDSGHKYQVHRSNFRQLPHNLSNVPYAAVACTLRQLMPNAGTEWTAESSALLKQIVQNKPVHVHIVRALSDERFEVDLITNSYGAHVSVRESFLYTGLARSRSGSSCQSSHHLIAMPSQRLANYELHAGDVLMIQMLTVEHPQDFHVIPNELLGKCQQLQAELQQIMGRMQLSQLDPIFLGSLQLCCVLQFQGAWHRARIEELLPEGYVLVRLVDSGLVQKRFWDQLFVLPAQFRVQEFSTRCALADVETLQQHGYEWTEDAILSFKQLTSNPKLCMEVISMRDNVAKVSLHITRYVNGEINNNNSNTNTNVAVQLVSEQHCVSSGESSRMVTAAPAAPKLDEDMLRFLEQAKQQPLQPSSSPAQQQLDKTQRTAIEMLYVKHPNEFYVTLPRFLSVIAQLRQTVQEQAAEMYERNATRYDWTAGEMCYVRVKASTDLELLWHRGQIVKQTAAGDFEVQLRDIGEVAPAVPASCLTSISANLSRVSSSAVRCQLYDIRSMDEEWSAAAVEFFKAQVQAYSSLLLTRHERVDNVFSVTLWGAHSEILGPFSPTRIRYTNIGDALFDMGWALRSLAQPQAEQQSCETLESSLDASLESCLHHIDNIAAARATQLEPLRSAGFEYNDEMPPLELLNDLNADALTTGCISAPAAWLQPRDCNKCIFTALPSYVNYECEVYLSLAHDKLYLHQMRQLLCNCYKSKLEQQQQQQQPASYVVGQPVVVSYHLDNLLYRGIVQSKLNAKGEHKVFYVDYGNVEKVKPAEMLPYAPFPKLRAMCWPVVIHGVQPLEQRYSIKLMDAVHKNLVMKLCSVRVMEPNGPKGLPLCQIRVGSLDIAKMMVDLEMAAPMEQSNKLQQQTLDSFKVFDELHELGQYSVLNDTTVPPKKKYKQSSVELPPPPSLVFEDDFDCNMAAAQPMQTSIEFELESDQNDDYENEQDNFSDEGAELTYNNDSSASEPEAEAPSAIRPQPLPGMDLLRRREELRYKERLDTVRFSPMDTSTERSCHEGVGGFKPQYLPAGVKEFNCTIDKVVSATELQISPKLTEFAKQELSLAQETSALIKDAKPLHPVKLEVLCLARYELDNQWYRAIIKELNSFAQQATVFYIDLHETLKVSYCNLKTMPQQLFMFPQRSFRVKLHGIKLNKSFNDSSVRQALQACLCQYPILFARVNFPYNYPANSSDMNSSELLSSSDSIRNAHKMLEVDIFESKFKKDVIYKPLIECRMFLLKK